MCHLRVPVSDARVVLEDHECPSLALHRRPAGLPLKILAFEHMSRAAMHESTRGVGPRRVAVLRAQCYAHALHADFDIDHWQALRNIADMCPSVDLCLLLREY